jgi:UDP-N-acetylglucosamine:LPS N-acetylglucosamine transferase
MSGAWGIGPLDDVADALVRAGYFVLVVAGRNERMRARVERLAAATSSVVPFGFTDRVPELMAACDVVVTSSGDTCTEARAVGRGMVLLDVVPGHGRENLLYQLTEGGAAVCVPDPDAIVAAVRAFLETPDRRDPPPVRSRASWEEPFMTALQDVGFPL